MQISYISCPELGVHGLTSSNYLYRPLYQLSRFWWWQHLMVCLDIRQEMWSVHSWDVKRGERYGTGGCHNSIGQSLLWNYNLNILAGFWVKEHLALWQLWHVYVEALAGFRV